VRIALDEAGYGPNCLSVPMRGKVRVDDPDQATHWGSHWWAGEELDAVMAIVEQAAPGAFVVHSSETMGFELFDQQAGDYIYVPVDPRLIDGLTIGLGELCDASARSALCSDCRPPDGGQGREIVAVCCNCGARTLYRSAWRRTASHWRKCCKRSSMGAV
jgi:hypothetical protein